MTKLIKITGFKLTDRIQKNSGISCGFFDCQIPDFGQLRGCHLTQSKRGAFFVAPPRVAAVADAHHVGISFDAMLQQGLVEIACVTYAALGGLHEADALRWIAGLPAAKSPPVAPAPPATAPPSRLLNLASL